VHASKSHEHEKEKQLREEEDLEKEILYQLILPQIESKLRGHGQAYLLPTKTG